MSGFRSLALALGIGLLSLFALGGNAHADQPHYFVRTDGSDTLCNGTSNDPAAHQPKCAFQTIGKAVATAASGDSISIGVGTFAEEVDVTKNLTISGAGQDKTEVAVPAAPTSNVPSPNGAGTGYALVAVDGATLHISDITLAGPWTIAGGCLPQFYGAFVYGGGTLDMSDATVTNIVNSDPTLYGCQQGVGIEIGRSSLSASGEGDIKNVTVTGYQKGAIVFSGDGTTGSVTNSTVTGAGPGTPLAQATAQNGIQISYGAVADVSGNTVTNNDCDDTAAPCGADPITDTQSVGILIYDTVTGVTVKDNTVTGNDMGIYAENRGTMLLQNNKVENNRYFQVELDQGTTTMRDNDLVGGDIGLVAASFTGDTTNTVGNVSGGKIVQASQNDVEVVNQNSPSPVVVLDIEDSTHCDSGQCKPYDMDGHGEDHASHRPHP